MPSLLPIFLDLKDKPVLLIGGGSAAYEKLEKLLQTGARIAIVAEHLHARTRESCMRHGISWQERAFKPEDAKGQFMIISAVNHAATHADIAAVARARGILINAVDAPQSTDCYFGAQIERGPLQVAISTHGLFPGVARAFRLWFEELLPAQLGAELEDLVLLRRLAQKRIPDPIQRMQALREQLQLWVAQLPPPRSGEAG